MARTRKPPRLYLHERPGRETVWIIRDGESRIFTGFKLEEKAEAQRALDEYVAGLDRPAVKKRECDVDRLLCADALAHYAKEHAPHAAAPEAIAYRIQRLLPFWGKLKVGEVRASNCRAYADFRRRMSYQGRATSAGTINNELNTLTASINFWQREFGLSRLVKVTRQDDMGEKANALERAEFARFLLAARRRGYQHIIRFALIARHTGTRQEAICKLRWLASLNAGHVDLDKGVMYRIGPNERQTKKRRPPCAIPKRLLWWLRKWHARDSALGLTHVITARGKPIDGIFKKFKNGEPANPWTQTLHDAGLTSRDEKGRLTSEITPHWLRHSCATWALEAGVDPWQISQLLGCTLDMIDRTYGHARLAVQARAEARAKGRA